MIKNGHSLSKDKKERKKESSKYLGDFMTGYRFYFFT